MLNCFPLLLNVFPQLYISCHWVSSFPAFTTSLNKIAIYAHYFCFLTTKAHLKPQQFNLFMPLSTHIPFTKIRIIFQCQIQHLSDLIPSEIYVTNYPLFLQNSRIAFITLFAKKKKYIQIIIWLLRYSTPQLCYTQQREKSCVFVNILTLCLEHIVDVQFTFNQTNKYSYGTCRPFFLLLLFWAFLSSSFLVHSLHVAVFQGIIQPLFSHF